MNATFVRAFFVHTNYKKRSISLKTGNKNTNWTQSKYTFITCQFNMS